MTFLAPVTVSPWTPTRVSASRISSSLNGLMTAMINFMELVPSGLADACASVRSFAELPNAGIAPVRVQFKPCANFEIRLIY
jgi:hypothetical protein